MEMQSRLHLQHFSRHSYSLYRSTFYTLSKTITWELLYMTDTFFGILQKCLSCVKCSRNLTFHYVHFRKHVVRKCGNRWKVGVRADHRAIVILCSDAALVLVRRVYSVTFCFLRSNQAKTCLKLEVCIAPAWNAVVAGACSGVFSLTWHCFLLSTYWHALGELELFCRVCLGLFANADSLNMLVIVHS